MRGKFCEEVGEGQVSHALRGKETALKTVARGPVPRDRCMARDRPSPYGMRHVFYRSAGALGCHTCIRAGFTRERSRARWHGEGQALALRYAARFFIVARGPVPRERSRENISSGPLGPACL